MSFSHNVKSEICRQGLGHRCCVLAECYGVLLFCNTFSPSQIRIVTEHRDFAGRLVKLFEKGFGVAFDEDLRTENGKFVFVIHDPEKLAAIYSSFGLSSGEDVTLHLNRGVLEDTCCDVSFVRGAFLAGGAVIDPEKRYHLELTTTHRKICGEVYSLLLDLGFEPKDTVRGGNCVLYFKQSDQIEDFLTGLGAPICAMEIMEAKVEKQMRNKINRVCNCDNANMDKTAAASRVQCDAIAFLQQRGELDKLPQKLQDIARLRLEDREASLSEMAGLLGISKSAANHRMRKILELAGKQEEAT